MYDNKGMIEMERKKRERRRAVRNRRDKAGETLTETLVAMLIIGLSSVLFLTMVGASGRISRNAEKDYKRLYEIISAADNKTTPLSDSIGEITVKGIGAPATEEKTVIVNWYGSTDYVLSYEVK